MAEILIVFFILQAKSFEYFAKISSNREECKQKCKHPYLCSTVEIEYFCNRNS